MAGRNRIAIFLGAVLGAAMLAPAAWAAGEAKNIVFFLGDGMGPVTVTASRIYKYGEAGKLAMDSLTRTARVRTFALDAQTTDSAPSMSAYMTGVKMNNEVLSMSSDTRAYDPITKQAYVSGANSTCPVNDGRPATTILELAKAAGKSVGAVTTTRITHATPGATYGHVCHRDGENDIAAQAVPGSGKFNAALGTGVDVLLGGGRRFFVPNTVSGGSRTDGQDLTARLVAAGYTYITTGAEFRAIDPSATSKLVGLFNDDHLNFNLDRVKNGIDEPSLADMTETAIKVLRRNGKGYFLMVEGGRIDHALHGTNARRALEDTIAFDDAIARALSLVDLDDTLVVVTADHDHTMAFNGYAHRGNPILGKVTDLKQTKVQGAPVLARAADGKPYTTLVFGNGGGARKATRDDLTAVDTEADDYVQEVAIPAWGETHGGGDVKLLAGGAGSRVFKGTIDNTRVFDLLRTASGL